NPKKKVTPLLIPYGRFSKVIIYYLARNNNIHRCLDFAVHHTGDDFILGNLKFVPKVSGNGCSEYKENPSRKCKRATYIKACYTQQAHNHYTSETIQASSCFDKEAFQSVKNQESEKSPKEIIKAKKEQGEEKQDSTYSISLQTKILPTTVYTMRDAMDKEVADKVKDHKRKHDSDDDEDDDDDEGPSAGSNQGRSTKKGGDLSDSAVSGSAKPPSKDDDQSSKKPRESEASASKKHPALTSTRWQITDTREAGVDTSMHRSDHESEHSEQSSDDIS
ncbi:hypothetical protein Tco_1336010, partial [Tanacetum coccineum]